MCVRTCVCVCVSACLLIEDIISVIISINISIPYPKKALATHTAQGQRGVYLLSECVQIITNHAPITHRHPVLKIDLNFAQTHTVFSSIADTQLHLDQREGCRHMSCSSPAG